MNYTEEPNSFETESEEKLNQEYEKDLDKRFKKAEQQLKRIAYIMKQHNFPVEVDDNHLISRYLIQSDLYRFNKIFEGGVLQKISKKRTWWDELMEGFVIELRRKDV